MKRLTFIVLFVGINILFIFLQIHKQSQITKVSYQNQRKKMELDTLIQQKEAVTNQLQVLKNPASVKKYATNRLNMKKTRLNQIKLLADQATIDHE
ncbi:hypothetical protein E3J79_00480 [Candidatus Dependentiae bacterium]|nr:MAG: hypothetical protein E3J79_00480 [Candidatus Dependentiae bacterium]